MAKPDSFRKIKASKKLANKAVGDVYASGGYGEHGYNMKNRPSGYLDGAKAIPGAIRPPRVTEGAPAKKPGLGKRIAAFVAGSRKS